jgi:hypothetical protein
MRMQENFGQSYLSENTGLTNRCYLKVFAEKRFNL